MPMNTKNPTTYFDTPALLAYYDTHKRFFSWRQQPEPYYIWLTEIMSQQTRMEVVEQRFASFIQELPDVASLATAPEDVYLKLWEGLGYYSRVRNLHKCAQVLMEEYQGRFPSTAKELEKLPGIGPYTAAAISSVVNGEPVPAIDGNLLRVFSRFTCYGENILASPAKKAATTFFQQVIAPHRPGDFNQARMDLGATICLANTQPLCHQCPLKEGCQAEKTGNPTAYPYRPKPQKRRIEKKTVLVIHFAQGVLLRKRPPKGLLAGLYEFPHLEGHVSRKEALETVESYGFTPLRIQALPPSKHLFSHIEWQLEGYEIFTDAWTEFSATAPRVPGDAGAPANQLFLADANALVSTWSIPSAFGAYRDHLLGR